MFKNDNLRSGFSLSKCPPTTHLLWQFKPAESIRSSVVVSENIILASGQDCILYALDLWTGNLLWDFNYDSLSCWGSHGSPTVSEGRVFAGAGFGSIYCIDLSSGIEVWHYDTQDAISSSPLVAEGKVFITLHNTEVIALDAVTGEFIWNYETNGSNRKASPAFNDGLIYIPTYDGRIVILDSDTGSEVETIKNLGGYVLTPVIDNGKLFVSLSRTNNNDFGLKVLDLVTKDVLWGDVIGVYQKTSPSVGYGKVFIGGDQLRAYNADTGELVWFYDNELDSDVALVDGKVIANFGKKLMVFDQATGDIIWETIGGSSHSSPAVASNMILVGGRTVNCYYAHPHDVALDSFDIPFPVDPEEQIVLSVNVTNEGLNEETNVQVQLVVDQEIIATQTIPSLASLSANHVTFNWTAPQIKQICELEVRVKIIPEEGRDDNNRLIRRVAIGGKTLRVPSEFETVAAALNAADPGDKIRISNGTYAETLSIDKSHLQLIAEEQGGVIINRSSVYASTITLDADFCELSGLQVINEPDSHNYTGIGIQINSSENRISNCTITGNDNGITIGPRASNNVIDGCMISTNNSSGIRLYGGSENNLIENCTISDNGLSSYNDNGVYVSGQNNRIVNCDIVQNQDHGITLMAANNCQLIDLTIRSNGDTGLRLLSGYHGDSSDNLIQGCMIEEHSIGMSIGEAPDNIFRNNKLQNNTYNLRIGKNSYQQDIDSSNLIGGKPILYLRDQSGVTVDGNQQDISMLLTVDCSDIHIRNVTFSGNYQGLLLIDTNDSIIENCTFKNNYEGIYTTYSSSSNIFRNCQIMDNVFGIRIHGEATYNRIENCLVQNNSDSGIFLDLNTRWMEVIQCEITLNGNGIYTESSEYHTIRANKIHNNTNGVVFGRNSFNCNVVNCDIFNNVENGISLYAYGIVSNNTIMDNGGTGIVTGTIADITNCIIRGNGASLNQPDLQVKNSNIEGGYDGDSNIDQNPMFIDEVNHDYRLQKNSPCIDTGTVPDIAVPDLDGDNNGLAFPDMGAHEYPGKPDIFGLSLGNRFVYTSFFGTYAFESERSIDIYDRTSFDVPAYIVSLSQNGVELQREWLEKQAGQVVLRQICEIQFSGCNNTIQFTDGLIRYWNPMQIGDIRNSSSSISVIGINDDSLMAGMKASVVKKEMLSLNENTFAAFKIRYTFRIWGNSITEQRVTFYEWVSPYLGVVKYSDDQIEDRMVSFTLGGGLVTEKMDSDSDNLMDYEEMIIYETNIHLSDTDADSLPDDWEVKYSTNPLVDDSLEDIDQDNLNNAEEYQNGTNPNVFDTDNDDFPDGWELANGMNPLVGNSNQDLDADSLSDFDEYMNNTDPNNSDTDNDKMPDGWEVSYGLNPLLNDASEDLDGDGVKNSEEYIYGRHPGSSEPNTPMLSLPLDGKEDILLTIELQSKNFSDDDAGDIHGATRWQISTDESFDSEYIVLDVKNDLYLTSFIVPDFILDLDSIYFWRIKFYDNREAESEWSEVFSFKTAISNEDDPDGNGIPEDQEVDDLELDLDNDGSPDVDQVGMKCIKTSDGNDHISLKQGTNIISIASIKSIDPSSVSDTLNKPTNMSYGLISFKMNVANIGDTAEATVYLSSPAAANEKWYKYDIINGWQDYSAYATFSPDRTSVTIQLKDGDYGDGDGVANGIIIDPSGLGTVSASSGGSSGGDSGGGGCFITTATSESF